MLYPGGARLTALSGSRPAHLQHQRRREGPEEEGHQPEASDEEGSPSQALDDQALVQGEREKRVHSHPTCGSRRRETARGGPRSQAGLDLRQPGLFLHGHDKEGRERGSQRLRVSAVPRLLRHRWPALLEGGGHCSPAPCRASLPQRPLLWTPCCNFHRDRLPRLGTVQQGLHKVPASATPPSLEGQFPKTWGLYL